MPLLPCGNAEGPFLRLRGASLVASKRPPPAPPPPLPRQGLLCACALALPPSRCPRLSQSVCRSLSSEQEERADFEETPALLLSFPSLSPAPHLSSPLFRPCAAMAELSAATQSPSVSSSSSGAEPSAPGSGSPGSCPALGAKSCGSSCAGEARRGSSPFSRGVGWGSRGRQITLPTGGCSPGDGRLETG